jgi:hypothetical protein
MSSHENLNSNIITHKTALGNDFVSGGFSISRNEITTVTEPRFSQRISLHNVGASGKTVLIEPEVLFTISSMAPYNVVGASIIGGHVGMFDASMEGKWENLKVDGRFRTNIGSKSTFSIDIIEQKVTEYKLDFSLDPSVVTSGLSNAQCVQLDGMTATLLSEDFVIGGFLSTSSTPSVSTVLTSGSYDTIYDNPWSELSLENDIVTDFVTALGVGYTINGDFIAAVMSRTLNIVYGTDVASAVGPRVIVRLATINNIIHPVLKTDYTQLRYNQTNGDITSDILDNQLFTNAEDKSVVSHDAGFGPSYYIADDTSIIIQDGGSGYDTSFIKPHFSWAPLQHDIFGKVSLNKAPDTTLLDIEHMLINGKSSFTQSDVELPRLRGDQVYRGGSFIFTEPTVENQFGSVTFITSTTDLISIDLKYFINPVSYPEYEHGLLQQLATDLCLHPYGNSYTGNWTKTEQKKTSLHLSSLSVGNDKIATMIYNTIAGRNGGWQPEDVGKTIREVNGSGEAVITSVETDGVRTPAFFSISISDGSLTVDGAASTGGFGYYDGDYNVNVTSTNPTDTTAVLSVTVENGSVDIASGLTISDAGNFSSDIEVLTIQYHQISSQILGFTYQSNGDFTQADLKETYDIAKVSIVEQFTTPVQYTDLVDAYGELKFDASSPAGNWFNVNEWGIFVGNDMIETQPYHLIYPNDPDNPEHALPVNNDFYQQNHHHVSKAIATIGSTFIVESEKGTDLLSSLADIVPGKALLPANLGHPHAISNIRKPQKWRIKFQYNDDDATLSVYAATAYQLQDDKTITRVQGRDGIKGSSVRLPGEMCEVKYDLSASNNKIKEPFFNRRGKTRFDVENTYPMSYRLTCTDHGTALFVGDQGAIDQDDDYSWFVIQRHVNQVTGAIEFEDGKSPVHCVYSPSKPVDEFSDFGQNYLKTYLKTPNEFSENGSVISTEGLNESVIYDISGKELTLDSKTDIILTTFTSAVVPNRYYSGQSFTNATYHDGSYNPFSMELFNYAKLTKSLVTDLSYSHLGTKGGLQDSSVYTDANRADAVLTLSDIDAYITTAGGTYDEMHGLQTSLLDKENTLNQYSSTATETIFDKWYKFAPTKHGLNANTHDYDPGVLEVTSYFMSLMEDKVGKVGFNRLGSFEYEPVMLTNFLVAYSAKIGPAYQGLWPKRIWAFEGDITGVHSTISSIGYGNPLSSDYEFNTNQWDISEQVVPLYGDTTSGKNETIALLSFDASLTTWDITNDIQDKGEAITSDSTELGTRAWDNGIILTLGSVSSTTTLHTFVFDCDGVMDVTVTETRYGSWGNSGDGYSEFIDDVNRTLEGNDTTVMYKAFHMTNKDPLINDELVFYFTKAGGDFNSTGFGVGTPGLTSTAATTFGLGDTYGFQYPSDNSTLGLRDDGTGSAFLTYEMTAPATPSSNVTHDAIAWVKGATKCFNFGVEYKWRGAGTGGVYVNPLGIHGDNTAPVKDIARLTVSVDGQEIEMSPTTNVNYIVNGDISFPADYTYEGTSLNSFIYYNDKLFLRYEVPDSTLVNVSYQNYSEDDINPTNSYMIKVAEDRDIPESWSNLHKAGKAIYRFVVREQDVLKPWDYHVSAVLPQIDSPAIINPMEQLSITQDKTFVFNFPTPMASQRYIYPASEMDMICYSGADSSIQGGYTEVGQVGNDKYSDDKSQYSSISAPAPGSELEVTYRSPYTWHLDGDDYITITPRETDGSYSATPPGNPTIAGIANKKSHVDRRIYVGTYSTRPNGSGMRVFVQINGGSIRPQYSDNIDRKSL